MNKLSLRQELSICRIVVAALKAHLIEMAAEYPHDSLDSTPFAIRRHQVALRICEDELVRLESDLVEVTHGASALMAIQLDADTTALRGLLAEIALLVDPLKEQVREMKWQVEVRRSACL